MSSPPEKKEQPSLIDRWKKSDNKLIATARELLWVLVVVGAIALTLFLVSGAWPAVVTIESESMVPHMNVGDLVFVVEKDRFGPLQTWTTGKETGYMKFGDYGDVIIYRRNGESGSVIPIPLLSGAAHPIIHRAMGTVEGSKPVPVYFYLYQGQSSPSEYLPAESISIRTTPGGYNGTVVLSNGTVIQAPFPPEYGYIVLSTNIAPNSGYITKGDNNVQSDQLTLSNPVQEDWVVGKALFTIPLLGYLPLNIVPVAIIIIAALFLYEWYRARKKSPGEQSSREQMKKKRGKPGK
ncbi:MAG: S26 family signal peptidase [Methanoregulaceae archaeon]|nr:S26 family signal peptidase [Methanoregulaceae archaeon]